MHSYTFVDVNVALPELANELLNNGEELGSRLGERVNELTHVALTLLEPTNRYITVPGRNASLPAQIAETLWVLAGRDDVAFLEHYLPRAGDFSDDGNVWRGAYGPRIRRWSQGDAHHGTDEALNGYVDQLAHVVQLLSEDPTSRRAVIGIYDPAIDVYPGKDIPCNDLLVFTSRFGKLDLHVHTRSNDLIWGWSGINQFEWSALQEIVAGMLGIEVGSLHFSITSLHVYDRHWKKADRLAESDRTRVSGTPAPSFDGGVLLRHDLSFDDLINRALVIEQGIRDHTLDIEVSLGNFPEPMLRSWLAVLAYHWTGDESYLEPYRPTDLYTAAVVTKPATSRIQLRMSALNDAPAHRVTHDHDHDHDGWPVGEVPPVLNGHVDPFADFVVDLHAEKDAAYGDSWKRRGELLAILANIARKVDRLGVGGAGDTAADTAIDLLVYLVKYRLWLIDHADALIPPWLVEQLPFQGGHPYSEGTTSVELMLRSFGPAPIASSGEVQQVIEGLKSDFELLQQAAENHDSVGVKVRILGRMISQADYLARTLWYQEQQA